MNINKYIKCLKMKGYNEEEIINILNNEAYERGHFSPSHAYGYSSLIWKCNNFKEKYSEKAKEISEIINNGGNK